MATSFQWTSTVVTVMNGSQSDEWHSRVSTTVTNTKRLSAEYFSSVNLSKLTSLNLSSVNTKFLCELLNQCKHIQKLKLCSNVCSFDDIIVKTTDIFWQQLEVLDVDMQSMFSFTNTGFERIARVCRNLTEFTFFGS